MKAEKAFYNGELKFNFILYINDYTSKKYDLFVIFL